MIIKIDVDGVIRDIITTMCKLYNQKFDANIKLDDIKHYDVRKSFHLLNDAVKFFFVDNAKEVFKYSEPCHRVKEAIDMLHNAGHAIIICTWQFNYLNKLYTLDFLEKNNIYYDDICFTDKKYLIQSDVMIDDNPEYLSSAKDSKKVLIKTPYNTDCQKIFDSYDSLYAFALSFTQNKIEI